MESTSFAPIRSTQRIGIVDALRGWALLGVVLMNYIDYYYLGLDPKIKTSGFDQVIQGIGGILFSAKSWTMLSFLFGYGFAVLMDNVVAKGINPYVFFSRRMFWLFILAIINSAFFFGDILKDYAVMGMVLLLFYRLPAKAALGLALVTLLVLPAVSAYIASLKQPNGFALMKEHFHLFSSYDLRDVFLFGLIGTYKFEIVNLGYLVTVHVIMLFCFLLGLAAQKVDFFGRLQENIPYLKRIFFSSIAFIVLMSIVFGLASNVKSVEIFKYYNPGFWFVIASMFVIASGWSWLYAVGKLKRFFASLQLIGRMTLTNYMVQNLIAVFLFSGVGFNWSLGMKLRPGYYYLFALIIYLAQVFFSRWWLSRFAYGPVEWIWRQLSYGKRLPLRRTVQGT